MDLRRDESDWIAAYLDWNGTSSRAAEATAVPSEEIVAAYLDWMDATLPAETSEAHRAAAERDAVLLMALRAESGCVHVLRQVLETGGAMPRALAFEALECAQRLLEDEQRALQEWPNAVVAADVRALAGKVLAMQAH